MVPVGSAGWAQLALAAPSRNAPVEESDVRSFMETDGSGPRSRLLVAGLAGLDRLTSAKVDELSGDLGFDLSRQTAWTRAIARAGERDNAALVTMLAGLGMQGSSWSKMDHIEPGWLLDGVRRLQDRPRSQVGSVWAQDGPK